MRPRFLPLLIFVLLLVAITWAYIPGVAGPTLLDDHSSLNALVGLEDNPEFGLEYIQGEQSGPLGRPVAMWTFVAERIYLGSDIAVTKSVNISIHLLNGVLVAWLLLLMFKPLQLPGAGYLAVVLAGIWLASPLWVSSVLYAVQRMALLSTSFMLMALVSYCYCRGFLHRPVQFFARLAVPLVFVLLGVFTKENAIVVIPIMLVLELFWFQCRDHRGAQLPWFKRGVIFSIFIGAVALGLAFVLSLEGIAASYRGRDFTLPERLMTEARVLWDYVLQFVWPEVGRMGIYHDDFIISRSLWEPVTTLPAILAWVGVGAATLVLGLGPWRWGKLVSLVPAWYMLGHAVESTVLPLELYFEHRNYFPAIGLLLAPALLYGKAVRAWPETARPLLVYAGLAAGCLLFLTSSQAQVWSSRPLLAFNHISGHPDSFRANTDMAVIMASLGDYERAAGYSSRARAVNPHRRSGDFKVRNMALACMANAPVPAEDIASIGVREQRPLSSSLGLVVLVRMLEEDRCPSFDRFAFADRLESLYLGEEASARGNRSVYLGLALLENALQRFEYADQYIDVYLELLPGDVRALLMKLHFSAAMRDSAQVEKMITQLQQLDAEGKLTERQRQTLALYLEN